MVWFSGIRGRTVSRQEKLSQISIWFATELSQRRIGTMDLVFCGTPQFAVPTLRVLAEKGHRIHLVVTQPDRPSGRGMELSLPPVKQLALELGMPIMQPEKIKYNAEFRAQLEEIRSGSDHRRRLWPHHSAMDDRSAAVGKL